MELEIDIANLPDREVSYMRLNLGEFEPQKGYSICCLVFAPVHLNWQMWGSRLGQWSYQQEVVHVAP